MLRERATASVVSVEPDDGCAGGGRDRRREEGRQRRRGRGGRGGGGRMLVGTPPNEKAHVGVQRKHPVEHELIGRRSEDVRARLAHAIEHILGIRVGLRLVEPRSIERSQGKAKRVIDRRNT